MNLAADLRILAGKWCGSAKLMKKLVKRLANLIFTKSLVTLTLTMWWSTPLI